jgi:hypothetical protein
MRFRVGQVVRIIWSRSPLRVGVVTKIGMLSFPVAVGGRDARFNGETAYSLELRGDDGMPCIYPASCLEPYHEPGDFATLSELLRGVVPAGKVDA